ncbi:hypothetical protein [Gloeobacter kilaueensis]|uniref:PD-(D/E)XK endonuclease-like domain-containing protein n=1 Tax=Gloeobacter kilaueensis (strain ATCC BAA-2537 / CCAP 1431/1 / ULC 316 / JS1) TaxID=1183438 RepID=U5QFR3_GLOK1|nr:hypothetical protein [Gloeobacter kilaueensis]AGY57776.1 hypothetical protein GKIL_1530 [Gloeobacter kilaueensis JS1]
MVERPPVLGAAAFAAFERCGRLFDYLYIDRLLPAVEDERIAGQRRYRRYTELMAKGRIKERQRACLEAEVARGWEQFLQSPEAKFAGRLYLEYPLHVQMGEWRVGVQLHRLAVGTRFAIVQWDTGLERPPDAELKAAWPVRLPLLLVCLVGSQLNDNRPIAPEQVQLTLWFTRYPEQPFHLRYSQTQLIADRQRLERALPQLRTSRMSDDPAICAECFFRIRCHGLHPERLGPGLSGWWEDGDARSGEEPGTAD